MAELTVIQLAGEVALAIIAGALLNLTPCVLPAIPVKIRTIAQEAGTARRQRVLAALAFAAGTLLFFVALGMTTAALHWTWGALFQSRALRGALIVVLLVFAYTTYRDVGIPAPQFAYTLRGRRYIEPFLSGLFCALLATPCTGPFLGGVLAFTITRPAVVTVAIFVAVGVGLALPYVVLLLWPRLLDRLPRPGAWTVRVRQGLAFVLLAAAAFFAQSLVPQGAQRWLWVAWLVCLAGWAMVVLWRAVGTLPRAIAMAFALAGATFVYQGNLLSSGVVQPLDWQPLTAVSWKAAKASSRPVLVEYTADWCINCKVLERTVYSRADVGKALRTAGVITLQADLTQPLPWAQKLLLAQGGAGLPYAVVRGAQGRIVARFAGFFTPHDLIRAIEKTSGEHS